VLTQVFVLKDIPPYGLPENRLSDYLSGQSSGRAHVRTGGLPCRLVVVSPYGFSEN